ncbi:Adenine dna glycosylase [Thalictrum thalictroides]|uniref:Adenine DNA glycosylase n=1 Tax=Thalictrum thalictroides TaxID=46969 RepID=A0A7J6WXF8_THATH|nr:Adenine dna glycosylase [Thalictrum thalictroides]
MLLRPRPFNSSVKVMEEKEVRKSKTKMKQVRKREPAAAQNTNKLEEDMEDYFSKEETHNIRASLLCWYQKNQRVVPWRITSPNTSQEKEEVEAKDQYQLAQRAYEVWVSEMMLQQTRVATVIEYYKRWMEKWPTIHHLAAASQEEVNHMWAGLGYYRRARFLLEGAKMVVGGQSQSQGAQFLFPTTVSALCKVPGVGQYTAGAIASIAFNQAVPVVDGNVVRVLARLKAISANPKDATTIKSFWKLAGQLVDLHCPGDFNQALMELGATICTPSTPSCSTCPISGQCRAFSLCRTNTSVCVTDYPTKVPKTKQRLEFCAVCVVEILNNQGPKTQQGAQRDNVFLVVKRPEEGLLAGLWEFPSVLMDGEADLTMRREAMDCYLKTSFKLDTKKKHCILSRNYVGECLHIFSHIRLRMYVELLVLQLKGGESFLYDKAEKDSLQWRCVDSNSIESIGLTSGVRKVYNMIHEFKQTQLPLDLTSRKRKPI